MKILLINVSFGIGSTGKIVQSLFEEYKKQGHEVYAIYGRHSNEHNTKTILKSCYEIESKFWHFLSLFTGNLYGGVPLSTLRIKRLIKKIKPDVIHLHCINGYFVNVYSLIRFLKKHNYPTVLTNHAEFMYTANCGYSLECEKWKTNECKNCQRVKEFNGKLSLNRTHHFYKKMKIVFSGFKKLTITNVSPWLTNRVSESPILNNRNKQICTVLNPIQNAETYLPSKINPYAKYNLPKDTKIVLHVTPDINNPEKGGKSINDLAKHFNDKSIMFFIKSNTKPLFVLEKNIINIEDKLNLQDLYDLYHFADLSLMLSKKETFSMVVAESLCCGTPVVGFKAGGPETITIPEYSSFAENGNINQLSDAILAMLSKDINKEVIAKEAKEKYSVAKISNEYLEIYKNLMI